MAKYYKALFRLPGLKEFTVELEKQSFGRSRYCVSSFIPDGISGYFGWKFDCDTVENHSRLFQPTETNKLTELKENEPVRLQPHSFDINNSTELQLTPHVTAGNLTLHILVIDKKNQRTTTQTTHQWTVDLVSGVNKVQ